MLRFVALLIALVGTLVILAPAAAHFNGAFHTRAQAENNVAKGVMVATIKDPRLGATLDTRVRCRGIDLPLGRRYNHFFCSIRPWNGAAYVKYHARRNGRYTLSLP